MTRRLLVCVVAVVLLGIGTSPPRALGVAFDWYVRNSQDPGLDVVPVPHAGHDWPASHSVYQTLYASLDSQGLPLALMLQNDTGPATGTKDPNALTTVMGYVPRLDYVFADFEDGNREANVLAMVSQVRSHTNPSIADAYIGNYNDYPGAVDVSQPWPSSTDRSVRDAFYRTSGLNIAQPNCYPYEFLEVHASSSVWGADVCPNERSALFWAPLERFSVAKRDLPDGDLLIPWLAGFVEWSGYDAPEPLPADHEALLQHMRLRGADGYYTLQSGIDGYSDDDYRADMSEYWHALDGLFASGETPEILNLTTDKTSGVEWSGMRVGNDIAILISNLSDVPATVDYPAIAGLPSTSPWIEPGTHQLLFYSVPEPATTVAVAGLLPFGLLLFRRRRHNRK